MLSRHLTRLGALAVATVLAASPHAAAADTLADTLIKAYQLSPILEANRAALRALDENVAQARSGKRPQVGASAGAEARLESDNDYSTTEAYSAGLNAVLNIYDHGQTEAAIQSAKASVAAGRQQLKQVEQDVFLDAVTAYMDVRRDLQFVEVARNNVDVLRQQVQAATDRFELGEVTRTDVSLAEARLAEARANLAAFQGQLEVSRELFRAVVGAPPQNLQTPPPLPALPGSAAEAEAIAVREHPSLMAARFTQTAAEFDLRRARSARGPTVDISSGLNVTNTENFTGRNENIGLSAGIEGNLPIYQGGRLSSLVRQAEANLSRRQWEVQNTARQIRRGAAAAWAQLQVARASISANQEQVQAARIAFEGVREEATLGARTTLDVLDREQELRDAQVQLAASIRDEYVAAYNLLSSMGLLTVRRLNLGIPEYDPDLYYSRVQNAPYSTVEGTILDKLRDRYSR